MKDFHQISTSTLLENARRTTGRSASDDSGSFALSVGFHLYPDLRVNLALSAAEEDTAAHQFLRILESYAAVLDECARAFGAEILEIQGERAHVFIDAPAVTQAELRRLFGFAIAVTQAVYDKIEPAAGEHWDGFSMAADFGPAVMIATDCGGGSLVSLGNVANTPAKRLDRKPAVQSGHIAVRRSIHALLPVGATNSEWMEFNVLEPSAALAAFSDREVNQRAVKVAANALTRERDHRRVLLANSAQFQNPASATVADPTRVQGYCLRADLDGFTRQVEAASKAGPDAVRRLVQRFHQIMGYAHAYAVSLGRPAVELPWAGDCATILVLPRPEESYSAVSGHLPITAALKWHQQEAAINSNNVAWNTLLQTARWAIGVAGGTDEEGSNGVMLVANVAAGGRTFRLLAGWGARRSNDAYQADGVYADDTVLHRVDYQQLETAYKGAFSELDTRFMRASLVTLRKCVSDKSVSLGKASPLTIPSIVRSIPAPRPHGSD